MAPQPAQAAINQQINFQGRLLSPTGAVVADGNYNMEFQIWQGGNGCVSGCTSANANTNNGGTLKWTEDWIFGSGSPDNRVAVKNGYFSVSLGSITALSAVDFTQSTLWLSMNVGDTSNQASFVSSGGYLIPFKRMGSSVYAFQASNSDSLGSIAAANYLQFGTGTLQADATSNSSIYFNKTGLGNFIQIQASGADAFVVTNSGNLQFGANGTHTISIASAGSSTAGKDLSVLAGAGGSGGTAANGGKLSLQGGAAAGASGNANGGDVLVYGGAALNAGTAGNVDLAYNGTSAVGGVGVGKTPTSGVALDVNGNEAVSGTLTVTSAVNANGGLVATKTIGVNAGTVSVTSITLTTAANTSGSNTANGISITPTIGNSTTSGQTANIINVGAVTGNANTSLNVLNVGTLTGTGAAENVINAGAGWDNILNSAGALNFTGAAASTWDIGNNTLSVQTTGNGAITTGSGLFTQGGNFTFGGTSARTITGPGAGGLTVNDTGGNLTLSTTTSGNISVSSVGTLALSGTNGSLSTGGVMNVTTGYQIGGAASTGNYLRGNGTNFVSSAIQAGDIPTCSGTCNFIQNSAQNSFGSQSANEYLVSSNGTHPAGQFAQASSATSAVLLLQGGATPGTGAYLLQMQDSTGSNVLTFDAAGNHDGTGYVNTPSGGIGSYGNLLVNSEALDQSGGSPPWSVTGVVVNANNTAAPDGNTTAEQLVGTGSSNIRQAETTSVAAGTYTFSVWLKQSSGAATTGLCIFATGGTGSPSTCTPTAVTPNGTDWQRFSVTQAITGSSITSITAQIGPGTGSTATVWAWGAQLVLGSTPGVYTRTGSSTVSAATGVVSNGNLQGIGVNATTGLLQGTGGETVTGTVSVNGSGSGTTTIGSSGAGAISIQGGSAGTTFNDTGGNLQVTTTTSGNISITSAGTFAVSSTDFVVSSAGAVTTGTWQGTAVGAQFGGTGQTTYATGDLLFASSSTALSKLAVGTATQCLVGGTTPAWGACGTGNLLQVPTSNTAGAAGANVIQPTAASITGLTVNGTSNATGATALIVNQAGATSDAIDLNLTSTSAGPQVNGLLVNRNGTGGTTTNGIQIQQAAGTLTNGLAFSGTIGTDIFRNSGTLSIDTGASQTIALGNSANAHTINIGTGSAVQGISIGSTNTTSATNIEGGTSGSIATPSVGIGNGASNHVIEVGTNGLAVNSVYVGSNNSTSMTTINAGTGNINLDVNQAGAGILIQTQTNNSTNAFRIQNASNANLFQVDTAGNNIYVGGNNSPVLQTWATNSTTYNATATSGAVAVTANGYMYYIGGWTGAAESTNVNYAPINANGSVGTFSTTTNTGFTGVDGAVGVVANGYVYVIGGTTTNGAAGGKNTVQFSRIKSDGTLGGWVTTNTLNTAVMYATGVVANGYIYVMGGENTGGTAVTTVQFAKLNADGTTGTWSTTGALPTATADADSVVANGYMYFIGGCTTSCGAGSRVRTIFYTKVGTGAISAPTCTGGTVTGSWCSAPAAQQIADTNGLGGETAVVEDGYLYLMGGIDNSTTNSQSAVYYSALNSDGSLGTNTSNTNALPAVRSYGGSVAVNGYVYFLGGATTSTQGTASNAVYYASTQRVQVGGSLDLVGLAGQTLNSPGSAGGNGSTGGSLTAGNIQGVGTLTVQGEASFVQSVSIGNNLQTAGYEEFQNSTDSTSSFMIQNASGTSLINGDTSNMQVTINSSGVPLVLNSTTSTGEDGIWFNKQGTVNGEIGISNSAGQITNGSASGDMNVKSANGNIWFAAASSAAAVEITANGLVVGKGSTGETSGTAAKTLVVDSSDTAPTAVNGGMYYNTTDNTFECGVNGAWTSCGNGVLAVATAKSTSITANSYTNFSNGSFTPPAGDCQTGVSYVITAGGYSSDAGVAGNPALRFELTQNGTDIEDQEQNSGSGGGITIPSDSNFHQWQLSMQITCYSLNTVMIEGLVFGDRNSSGTLNTISQMDSPLGYTRTGTVGITDGATWHLQGKWVSFPTGGTFIMSEFIVQRLAP